MNALARIAAAPAPVTLEPAGIVVMTLSILIVCWMTVFCIARIMRDKSPGEHHHTPLDIDTHDRDR